MPFRGIISENHTEHVNTPLGQNAMSFNGKVVRRGLALLGCWVLGTGFVG